MYDDEYIGGKKPLFKGITRVPRAIGIPRTIALLLFMFCSALFMIIHIWALLIFAILWIICKTLTQYDDRMFRIIGLWFKSKFINSYESKCKQWGGSSYSPVSYKRKR